jgi:hypothetical protein
MHSYKLPKDIKSRCIKYPAIIFIVIFFEQVCGKLVFKKVFFWIKIKYRTFYTPQQQQQQLDGR